MRQNDAFCACNFVTLNLRFWTRALHACRRRLCVHHHVLGAKSVEGTFVDLDSKMSLPFDANERVLCYHGPLVYEAKVLKADTWDETNTKTSSVGPHFFVHYKGWKQTCVRLKFKVILCNPDNTCVDGTSGCPHRAC